MNRKLYQRPHSRKKYLQLGKLTERAQVLEPTLRLAKFSEAAVRSVKVQTVSKANARKFRFNKFTSEISYPLNKHMVIGLCRAHGRNSRWY